MKAAYYALHYGAEWLRWSLRSIRPYLDEIYVFYTAAPSFGHGTELPNPESRDQLYEIAKLFGVHWHDADRYDWEGKHRDAAVQTLTEDGADLILTIDADEVWDGRHLEAAFAEARQYNSYVNRCAFRHFWRSLGYVCLDGAYPSRIFLPKSPRTEHYIGENVGVVNHFGYAQSTRLIEYKMAIHGHKGEWRPEWFERDWLGWTPETAATYGRRAHPTSADYWEPVPFNRRELAYLVGDHPYFDLPLIP